MNPGHIITGYSTGGGVGRTMMLTDLAWILASQGNRVIVIDWNLDAPGVADYLWPFLATDHESACGVIDLLWDELLAASQARQPATADASRFQQYVQPLTWESPIGGHLDFVSVGRAQTLRTRASVFPWEPFALRYGGMRVVASLRAWLRGRYDYTIIDSRIGELDKRGICTVQLPDTLVCPFSMVGNNPQRLYKALSNIFDQRPDEPLRVFPVPTGVQLSEKALLERMRTNTQRVFAGLPELNAQYWGDVEVLHEPFYAYQKVPSVFAEPPGRAGSLLSTMERIARRVSNREVAGLSAFSEPERSRVLSEYQQPRVSEERSGPGPPEPFDDSGVFFFVSYKREEFHRTVLTLSLVAEMGYRLWWDSAIVGGDQWERRLEERIASCHGVLLFMSELAMTSPQIRVEIETAQRLHKPIVPIRLDTSLEISAIEDLLGRVQFVEDSRGSPSETLESALRFALEQH